MVTWLSCTFLASAKLGRWANQMTVIGGQRGPSFFLTATARLRREIEKQNDWQVLRWPHFMSSKNV
jgi:hypothetical protein